MFWLQLGLYYFSVDAGQASPTDYSGFILVDKISIESINDHAYTWIFALATSVSVVIFLIAKAANSAINGRSIVNVEDALLFEIPASEDPEIIEFNERLGISVRPDRIFIPLLLLNGASLEALARDLGALLYLSYEAINDQIRLGRYSALHDLADLLLDNWPDAKIMDFIEALGREKGYLGRKLEAAVRRRDLERQIAALEEEIRVCQEQENSKIEDPTITRNLSQYEDLLRGRSAAVKWFRAKLEKFSLRRKQI
ncbi:MAG: hypothetical protein WC517_00710 [Patescibacteria group bacterium]